MVCGGERVSYELFKSTIGKTNSEWLRKAELTWLFENIQQGVKMGELDDKDKTRSLVLSNGSYDGWKVTLVKQNVPTFGGSSITVSIQFTDEEMKELMELHQKLRSLYDFNVSEVTADQMTQALKIVWTNRELDSGHHPIRMGALFSEALAKLSKILPAGNCPVYPSDMDVSQPERLVVTSDYEHVCLFMENMLTGLGL